MSLKCLDQMKLARPETSWLDYSLKSPQSGNPGTIDHNRDGIKIVALRLMRSYL
jgi:hypothetical protein